MSIKIDSPPMPGTLMPLASNVYRLTAANPGPMTGPGTNTYIYGEKELAVFDAGPDLGSHIDAILNAQQTLSAPITKLFSSHTHSDHSPAVAPLVEALPDVQVIGLPAPVGQAFEDSTFKPTHEPSDNQVFMHDGQPVRVIYTPGHVQNHCCFYIEQHKMLTTGDHLMNGSTVVIIPPKGSMKDYIESLQKLASIDIDLMLPGHGPVIENPESTVKWTIEHRLARESKVVDALQQDEAQSIVQLVSTVYDDVDVALHGIAAMSLHAHLIKLELDGRASEQGDKWVLIQ